jgi:microsomal epoxide hydrolase
VIADLRARLKNTRWNDAVTDDWSYGTQRSFLEKLVQFWLQDYDWTDREAALNELPHFRANVDGFRVHFLHFKGKPAGAKPFLVMNGWPSSFIEYQKLAPLLLEGGFEVVMPALPGFGVFGSTGSAASSSLG